METRARITRGGASGRSSGRTGRYGSSPRRMAPRRKGTSGCTSPPWRPSARPCWSCPCSRTTWSPRSWTGSEG